MGHRFDFVATRHHDDRHRHCGFKAADLAAGGKAVHAGHVDVEQDQVGRHALVERHGLLAVFGFDRIEPDLAQHFQHQQAHDGVVVGDQHGAAFGGGERWHVMFPFLGWH